jgi:hypothetical protein
MQHIHTPCGQNAAFLLLNYVLNIVATNFKGLKQMCRKDIPHIVGQGSAVFQIECACQWYGTHSGTHPILSSYRVLADTCQFISHIAYIYMPEVHNYSKNLGAT